LNESGTRSKGVEEEKQRVVSCLREDIKGFETSKEYFGKQILLQRYETAESSTKLKMKIDLGNKLKVSSKERQDESARLNESRILSETIAEVKEIKLSCLKVNIKELETSKEVFNKQITQTCDENTELSETLKTKINSGNKLQIVSKVNQVERTRLNELREISETVIVNETYKLICSSQTRTCLKEDIKYITISKESFEKKFIQQRDETNNLNVKLNTDNKSGMQQKMVSKENQDDITRAEELRELLEARAGENKSTISCVNKDIPTIKTSKEDFNKQILEKRNETSKLSERSKTEIESKNELKRLSKDNQDDITKLKESGSVPTVIKEEKERMISCWIKDIEEIDNQVEKYLVIIIPIFE